MNEQKPAFRDGQRKYSVSLIKDHISCPAKSYARITRQPTSRGMALVNGSSVHEALESYAKNNGNVDAKVEYKKAFDINCEQAEIFKDPEKFEEGEKMLDNAIKEMSKGNWIKKIDPNLVELSFKFERKDILYTGKIDLMYEKENGELTVFDYKTSRNSPSPYELDNDLQFTMYPMGAYSDATLPTYGKWSEHGIWVHLRGKVIEKESKKLNRPEKKQFFFHTRRTPEIVEKHFTETIEPIVELMEKGVFYRVRGQQCSYCSYFRRDLNDCGVDLPKVVE